MSINARTEGVAAPEVRKQLDLLRRNITRVIRGKDSVVDKVLITLAAGGHALLEDLPGLGKTTLAYCLARSIDCDFRRIQFTSDLLPTDVMGVSIYDEHERRFIFRRGPIFANIVLADEINRTTPKTQSALLEVMDRGKVSVEGETQDVGSPFMVFATQNPTDFEGTFPLPESQMDRFLMRLQMGYPSFDSEMEVLSRGEANRHYDYLDLEPVTDAAAVLRIQEMVPQVFLEDSVLDYLLRIVTATRSEVDFRNGVSTRGAISLKTAAQARALLLGRNFVMPEDIAEMVTPVFSHRLSLQRYLADPLEERRNVEAVLKRIVDSIAQPS